MKQLLIIIAMLLIYPASAQGKDKVINIDMTLSGTVLHVSDVRTFYDVDLKGSPGAANARGAGDGYFSDLPGTPCPDIGDVDGLKLNPAQMNVVFKDGSMFYGTVIEEESFVCFASPIARASYEIVGGTGRFEGATGYIVFDLLTHRIESGSLVTPETGSVYGEIILP
jgi:hypothetical protein